MSKCHVFSVDDAVQYGVEKAVILQNIRFWLEKVKANDKDDHKHDGYYWTYNSARAFAEIFPYYNKSKVHRLLTQLEGEGAIISGNFNKAGYDRTKWYSMPEFSISNNCNTQIAEVQNGNSESATPIPYVITDVNPDVISNTISDEQPKADKKKLTERELLVKSLFKKWNELSGQSIRPLEKRLSNINARLEDGFTVDEIITAMTFVATDKWHVDNGHNTIELAIRSTDQLEKKLIKANSSNQLTVNNQVNNYGQQQAQQNQSSSDKYIEQLKREYLQGDGSEQTIKDVN